MLHANTVHEYTLELLKRIESDSKLNFFYLAGGTALALQIGHRISVDLDFFSHHDFNENDISEYLISNFNAQIVSIANNSISCLINNIKVEFIAHQYPLLKENNIIDNIRLASFEDIAAMKINAARNRGTKKDFVDLYFLLKSYSIQSLLEFANKKYPNHIDLLTLKSLVYFEEANQEPDCQMLLDVNWEEVKNALENEITPLI